MRTYCVKMFSYFPNVSLRPWDMLYSVSSVRAGWLGVATSTKVIEQTWAIGSSFVISKDVYIVVICRSRMSWNELKLIDISFETCVGVIRQNSVKLGKTNFNLFWDASYCQRLDFFYLFKSFSDAISDSACALWGSTMPRLLLWHFVASQKCIADSKRNSWLCWKVPLPGIAGQLWDTEVQKHPETMMQQNKEEGWWSRFRCWCHLQVVFFSI